MKKQITNLRLVLCIIILGALAIVTVAGCSQDTSPPIQNGIDIHYCNS